MAIKCARWAILAVLLALLALPALALERLVVTVDGLEREALVYLPPGPPRASYPLVFAFHGHGGTMALGAGKFNCEAFWPEAIVVYPQGLPTPGALTDPEGLSPGWQSRMGDMADRDLHFFDEVLGRLEKAYPIDPKRVYALGHSNGGAFAYVLWAARGERLAAIAPVAAILASAQDRRRLEPKPVFALAGKKDPLVKFSWQDKMVLFIRNLNTCGDGVKGSDSHVTDYPSSRNAPVSFYVHEGGHELPQNAMPLIIAFFKGNPQR